MSNIYKGARKEDLINLLIELNEEVNPETETILQLKTKIEATEIFKQNVELVADLINSIIEDRKSKLQIETQKLEMEKIKLAQLEKQLEIENAKAKNPVLNESSNSRSESSSTENSLENLIRSVRALTIPIPTKAENFNLFFQTLERAFIIKNVPEDFKSEILINILGEKLNNILCYISNEDVKSYETVKHLVLKEYQPTAQECLFNFRNARKEQNETYVQFASRLNSLFRYYLELRNVHEFEELCDLIVSDQIFQCLDKETSSHINIKQGESWFKPKELAKECDIFKINKSHSSTRGKDFENNKNIQFYENVSHFRNPPLKVNKEKRITPISCYICSENHYVRNCPNRYQNTVIKEDFHPPKENANISSIRITGSNNLFPNSFINELEYVSILIDNVHVNALKDSGSELVIINKRIASKNKLILSKITLTSCFQEQKTADLSKFIISLEGKKPIEITCAICENLSCDVILPTNVFEILKTQSDHSVVLTDNQTPFSSRNELSQEKKQNSFSSVVNENKCVSNSFLLNMCNAVNASKIQVENGKSYNEKKVNPPFRERNSDSERRRFSDNIRQKEIEKKNKEEYLRLERERERLRMEWEKFKKERDEVLRLEREKAELRKMTRITLEDRRGFDGPRKSRIFWNQKKRGWLEDVASLTNYRRRPEQDYFHNGSRNYREMPDRGRYDWKNNDSAHNFERLRTTQNSFEDKGRNFERLRHWKVRHPEQYSGPYKITRIKCNDRYVVEKVGDHEGPNNTSTSADHMKPWGQILTNEH